MDISEETKMLMGFVKMHKVGKMTDLHLATQIRIALEKASESDDIHNVSKCSVFYSESNTTSATKCKFCCKEKWEH